MRVRRPGLGSDAKGWPWLRLVLGLVFSVVAIVFLMQRISWHDLLYRLTTAHRGAIAFMLLLKLIVLLSKWRRWMAVLDALARRRLAGAWGALATGQFLNLLLPLKLGEVVRGVILRRRNSGVSLGDGLVTIGSERLLDAGILTLLTAVALQTIEAPRWITAGVGALLALSMVALIAVPLLPYLRDRLPADWPKGLHRKVVALLGMLEGGTRILRRPRRWPRVLGWTVAIWLGEAASLFAVAEALDLPVSFPVAVVVTLLYTFGMLIPAAPVQVGTHQALAILFLAPFGVSDTSAVSLSLLLQAGNLMVLAATGLPALLRELVDRRQEVTASVEARGQDPTT